MQKKTGYSTMLYFDINPAETVQSTLRIMAPILQAIMHFADVEAEKMSTQPNKD